MKKVVILGGSGFAHVIADIITASGDEVVGFLDDDVNCQDRIGQISDCTKFEDCYCVIGVGSPEVKEKFSKYNLKWYTAIHPTAVISPSAKIGEGTVVMPNAVINARSVIGKHCIVNTSSVVEHDNVIEDFVHISVGTKLGGTVKIEKSTWVGIGSTVKNNVSICKGCLIGAGAVVVKDITESGTYVGVPAKKIK